MKFKLFFLIAYLPIIYAENYGLAELVLIATEPDAALKVAALIPAGELKLATKNKIKTAFKLDSLAAADTKIKEQAAKLGGGAGGMSQAQIDTQVDARVKAELAKINPAIPTISTKAEAKTELVKLLKDGVGAELLQAVYATNSPKDKIVDLLQSTAPAA